MVSSSFMGESLLRIRKMSRTTFSKTEGQKKTVRSPKTYEPKRLQPYSSCWSRLFYSLTRMAMQTRTHTQHTHTCSWLGLLCSHPQRFTAALTPRAGDPLILLAPRPLHLLTTSLAWSSLVFPLIRNASVNLWCDTMQRQWKSVLTALACNGSVTPYIFPR